MPGQEPGPGLVNAGLGPVARHPADDLGGLHQGVVDLVALRPVPGRPGDPQGAPERALLGHDQGQLHPSGRLGRHPAGLGQHVVGADHLGHVLGQPLRPVGTQRLLVGHPQVDERALGPEPLIGQLAGGHRHGGGQVEHVDRAPAPHLPVDELAAEGVVTPPVGADGYDIGVAHEQQGRRRRVRPLDPGHDAGPPRLGLVALDVDARALEHVGEDVGAAVFVARLDAAVVHALVPDQHLQELGDLTGEWIGHRGTLGVHTAGRRSCDEARPHRRRAWSSAESVTADGLLGRT